jgi:hypothetical protein
MPAATIDTVVPDTVHTDELAEVNTTVSPEVAVAEMPNGASPNTLFAIAGKVMVWFVLFVLKPCDTCGAAL